MFKLELTKEQMQVVMAGLAELPMKFGLSTAQEIEKQRLEQEKDLESKEG